MSELIRREDAINAMAELQGIAQSKAELTGISKAWKRIKALPTVSPWHRVEEPPKESGRFLIGCFFDDGSFGWEAAEYDGTEWENDHGCYCGPDYWMPIEPPGEE